MKTNHKFQSILEQIEDIDETELAELFSSIREIKTPNRRFSALLPPLGFKTGTETSASENDDDHQDATFVQKRFSVLDPLQLHPNKYEMIWGNYETSKLTYSSESDIQTYVRCVLIDAICVAGLSNEVTCSNEPSIYQLRPDIWIVCTSSGVPIGVVEVKKPDKNIMNSPSLHGQIFDYMLRLRHFIGLKSVFGITTTYAQWRIY
jgi:hypothetical protein